MFCLKKVFFIVFILFGLNSHTAFSMEFCKAAFTQMTDNSALKVFGYTAGSVVLYSAFHHAIAAGLCPESYGIDSEELPKIKPYLHQFSVALAVALNFLQKKPFCWAHRLQLQLVLDHGIN